MNPKRKHRFPPDVPPNNPPPNKVLNTSIYTLQKLHQRAVKMLHLIDYCERMQAMNLKDSKTYKWDHVIEFHIKEAWRCRRIGNYLKKRYFNLLTTIQTNSKK